MWIRRKTFDAITHATWWEGWRGARADAAKDESNKGDGRPPFTERETAFIAEQRRILAIQHAVEMTPTPETLLPLAETIEAYLRGDEPSDEAPEYDGPWPPDIHTAFDAAVESDERVQAWDQLAKHPFFASCFATDEPLSVSMLAKLDGLLATESIADDDRTHLVDTAAVKEAREILTEYEGTGIKIPKPTLVQDLSRPVVAPGFPNRPDATDVCKHCGRPIHVGDVFRDRGRKVWYHDTGFNVCLEPMGGTTAEPARGPQGA